MAWGVHFTAEALEVGPNLLALALALIAIIPTVATVVMGRRVKASVVEHADTADSSSDTVMRHLQAQDERIDKLGTVVDTLAASVAELVDKAA